MSSNFLILTAVGVTFFSEAFLYGVAVPILPFMLHERAGFVLDDLQWYCSLLLTAYSASCLVFAPLAGFVTDKATSRKRPLIIALILMLISVITFFSAQSIWLLFLARCLQGLSTAFIWIVGFTICSESDNKQNMGQVMGTMLGAADFGAFFSPALGGFLYSQFGITAVVIATSAISLFALLFGVAILCPKDTQAVRAAEQETSEVSEHTPLLPADNSRFVLPPSSNRLYQAFPIIRCFQNRSLVASIILVVVSAMFVSVFDATVPLHARQIFGFDSLNAGLLFLPIACTRVVAGPFGGWLVDKTSPRTVSTIAYTYFVPILISLRFVKSEPREAEIGLYCVLLALAGIGSAMASVPSFVESDSVVDRYHQANPGLFGDRPPSGALFGIYLASFGAGSAIGPVVAGALRNNIGYGNMNAVLAVISAAAAVISYALLERPPVNQKSTDEY
ncbi:major facilitator superfamily domain-containing protein [Xylaria venustula]|nr:major facilitator superfamily domain-containing protein [Xylaria venustula]